MTNMIPELEKLKAEYEAKQAKQTPAGKLAKLSEEASELAAAINKYLQIDMGLYECRSSKEKAWDHVIEEVGDVLMMLKVCKLTLNSADQVTRGNLIHRMIYKAFRFVGREKDYKRFMLETAAHQEHQKIGIIRRGKNRRGKHRKDRTIEILIGGPGMMPRQGIYTGNENPWREGMAGDFE